MATAVLDFDIENVPKEIPGLERYRSALALIRLRGRPVGQALLSVADRNLNGDAILDALLYAADSGFWEHWLRSYLGIEEQRENGASLSRATVAVCTRDRPRELQRCLDALMCLYDDGQELLVIDNCPSNEDTRRLVEGYKRVRYVREPRAGLDIARNRALREASHEIIAFADDDTAPDPVWLRSLLSNFHDPLVLCVTGLTMPMELETEAQEFFQRAGGLGRGFKRTIYDSAYNDPLVAWLAGAGANMALRRSVLSLVGPFDERLDVGTPVPGGGDADIFRRILAGGYRIVYAPEALNWHYHRSGWNELRRQLSGYEKATFAVWAKSLFSDREVGALIHARDWLRREVPGLLRILRKRPGSAPRDLFIARILGAAWGPWAYLYAHWVMRK